MTSRFVLKRAVSNDHNRTVDLLGLSSHNGHNFADNLLLATKE